MKQFLLKLLDATLGWFLCWTTGACRHLCHRNDIQSPGALQQAPTRLLIIRPGGMGDMILLLPTLTALRKRFPTITLDLICEKRNRDVLNLAHPPDHILLYDSSPLRLLIHLLRHRYDAVIDTEQFHYFSALMAILARAPIRIGFKISPGRNLLYTHLVNYELEGYEANQFMALLRPFGITEPAVVEGALRAGAELPGALVALLSATPGARLITLHVGSTTRYKQWPDGRYGELLRTVGQDPRLVFVILGSKADRRQSERVATQSKLGQRVLSLAGRLTMAETAAVLARSSLYIGGDSGLTHMAVALVIPTVTLFGPSDSQKWGARSKLHAIVKQPPPCAPCFIFGYHKFCHSIACMNNITVDDVAAACRRALG